MRSLAVSKWCAWALVWGLFLAGVCPHPVAAADSVVRGLDLTIPRGETNRLFVVLDSQGNENAIAFSLCYDTNLVSFVRAVRGVDSTNAAATLVVGSTQTNRGRIGLLLG